MLNYITIDPYNASLVTKRHLVDLYKQQIYQQSHEKDLQIMRLLRDVR